MKIMYHDKTVWNFISKNKPEPERNVGLTINLFLGYLRGGTTWHSADEYNCAPGALPILWDQVVVTVSMDHQVIYSGSPTHRCTIEHTFQDSNLVEDRVLTIAVQGFSYDHNRVWPATGELGGAALQVTGNIDNIPLQMLTSKFGQYMVDGTVNIPGDILCQNGFQVLKMQTPFYSWLHQRRDSLIWELTYPNGKK